MNQKPKIMESDPRLFHGSSKTSFSADELLQLARLITTGEMSTCFANEVTNPLMLMRGHLRYIEENLTEDHPLRTSFEVIDRSARRIEDIMKRVLDFSRNRSPEKEKCRLPEVVSEAVHFIQPYLRTRYVDVRIQLDSDLPLVEIDRWQIVQVLVSLMQNAADAMTDTKRRFLFITGRCDSDYLHIAISDTGLGIPADNLAHIFEPLFTTKRERRNGLGLYISKQVVEGHGGSIVVETGDQGTTFVINLPVNSGTATEKRGQVT